MLRRGTGFFKLWNVFVFQCACFSVFSQEMTPVIDKFRSYAGKAIQEKIFLHTDREFYVAGEIVWFRIYYVDGSSHKPLQFSKVVYVEILNEKNEPVQQAKISLLSNESRGSFYLPTSLNTGYYTIKAYTNWMKNFDAGYFFEKKIAVVNTLKVSEQSDSVDTPVVAVQFFPEGGNLVSGIESRVGFIISNASMGINNARGYIIDNNGDTIIGFSPLKFGIGNFTFKALAGSTYHAIVVLPEGLIIRQSLPEIYTDGYVMNLKESNNKNQLLITVKKKTLHDRRDKESMILAVHTRQVLQVAEKGHLNAADSTVFIIDKNRIGNGVTHFTLFNEEGKPVCERLFYVKPPAAVGFTISSDKTVYARRQPIDITIKTSGHSITNFPFDLSASVYFTDALEAAGQSTILEYMWLTSDLMGNIESPVYYFSDDPDAAVAIDNLMLTHGWRRFRWEDIWQGNDSFIKYQPELNGHLVTGTLKDKRDDKPMADMNAYLTVPGRPFGFYTARSDKNGTLRFEVKNYYGNSRIIAQPGIGTDSIYKVDIVNPFALYPKGEKYIPYLLSEKLRDQLLRRSIGMQVQNIYAGDSLKRFSDPFVRDTLPFYGLSGNTYRLDDYKRFTTMEEVLREYVREIGVSVRNKELIFKIFSPALHNFFDGNELVLLDGVALTNQSRIFSYDPLKIKRIDVITDSYVLGQSMFNGIASFTTYEGVFDGFELNPKLTIINYNGLQLKREFYSPVYSTKEQIEKKIPDLRNTLFWDASIRTGADGKATRRFFSSDMPGKYIVIVQGMNENGEFISGSAMFEVK